MTVSLFQEWFVRCFCPAVGRYCAQHGLPGNPDDLSDNMHMEYLPKSSMALLQPMNEDVIATFKVHYLRRVFRLLAAWAGGMCEPSAVPAL